MVDRCLQILGGMALPKKCPLERWYRNSASSASERAFRSSPDGSCSSTLQRHCLIEVSVCQLILKSWKTALPESHLIARNETTHLTKNTTGIFLLPGQGCEMTRLSALPSSPARAKNHLARALTWKSFFGKRTATEMWLTQKDQLQSGLEIWKPIVAAVNGYCLGGGMTLLMATDVRVAAEHATFALSEVKRGIVAGNGGTQRILDQLPRAIAMEVLLTGDRLTPPPLNGGGLVNKVVPLEQLRSGADIRTKDQCQRATRVKLPKSWRCRSREMSLARVPKWNCSSIACFKQLGISWKARCICRKAQCALHVDMSTANALSGRYVIAGIGSTAFGKLGT